VRAFILCLTLGVSGCDAPPVTVAAKPPLKHIEVYGHQAIAELVDGVSARTVVGLDLFADLSPGQKPEEIEARIGKPLRLLESEFETVFVYEIQGKQVGVVRHTVLQSGGGPSHTSFELRAFPKGEFVTRLPDSLRELIQSESELREIHFRSTVRDGWGIHIRLQDGRVLFVGAVAVPS